MYIEDSVDERHMWRLGRLVRLLEHVYHSISLLALVDLHRLSFCLDGWYLVLLYNWDIDGRDVLDQRNWCLLHHWHIDNFVDGLCLSLHWDIDNLVNELHLRDLHSFLHLLNHRHLALHHHKHVCNLLPTAMVSSKI